MTEDQLKQAIALLLTNTNRKNIDGNHAQLVLKHPEFPARFEQFMNEYDLGSTETQPTKSELLEWLGTVKTSATTEKFIASEKFILDIGEGARVKIGYLGDQFKAWFGKKIEEPIAEQTLRYGKLRKSSVDGLIITEIGGEEKSETTLSEMWDLMLKQANGEKGDLLTNGYANIFYIKDDAGVLRTVVVYWLGDGWRVGASTVGGPHDWSGVNQVFSRNSELVS